MLSYTELLAKYEYQKKLLDALVFGIMPEDCDLTTFLYAMRGKAYNKYITSVMDDEDFYAG